MTALEEIRAARGRVADAVLETPLVRLDAPEAPCELWLKLECLQPIGSFKLRGALNAIRSAPPAAIARGVLTASAGNMAQGVAWAAREAGIHAVVVAPDTAPQTKLRAVARLGGEVIRVPHETWWQTMLDRAYPGLDALFVHPVEDEPVIAGNGTIGLELCEQLDGFDVVVVPMGGGGLATGVATALKALRPAVGVFAAEPETAAPLTAALAAGEPVEIEYRPSWVDGAGGRSLLPSMWPRLSGGLLDGAFAVPLADVAAAVKLLAERARVVVEGAGALGVAAALAGRAGTGRVVCVVSGGNIDPDLLAAALEGRDLPG